mmetsp:Transcript_21467/g.32588  ORF Transcript_21467/g.32588 Transcript_21467/m.32588 type:complete len:586 (-) Transcript_21467:90-1847(-)
MKFSSATAALLLANNSKFLFASAQVTILDVVVNSDIHTTLEAAVLAAPEVIRETLSDETASLTLFAPDDTAFEKVPADYLTNLLSPEWSSHLVCLLTSHVLGTRVASTDLPEGSIEAEAVSGEKIVVTKDEGGVTVDGVRVTAADIAADNGVIHSISERPILPSCVEGTGIETLQSMPLQYLKLTTLIEKAGLTETLKEGESFTIFAPTNSAFSKLDKYIIDFLNEDMDALAKVLTYHVVAGNAYLAEDSSLTTVEGGSLDITGTADDLQVNGIDIAQDNLLVGNGVIHQIKEVLIPDDLVLPDPPECTGFACFFQGIPCFSGSAMVETRTMGKVPMKDLKLGDEIAVGNGNYEPVYSFGHYHPTAQSKDFVELMTKEQGSMKVSKEHLVFVQDAQKTKSVTAGSLQKGDRLVLDTANGDSATISSIKQSATIRDGLYAPFTPSGKFVVNDHFVVSSFIGGYDDQPEGLTILGMKLSFQWMSHAFEFPHRVVCHYWGQCLNETYDENGLSNGWATLPLSFINTFVFNESTTMFKPMILSIMVGVFAVFNLIEMVVFQYPSAMAAVVAATMYLANQKKKNANKNIL